MLKETAHSPALAKLAEQHRIRLIIQFGSTVTDRRHPGSDLDLAVLLDRSLSRSELSMHTMLEIQESLQEVFPGQTVDFAFINHADPLFLKKMVEHCRLLYGDARELARLRLYAFKRYQDHRRFLEFERRYVERQVSRHASTP